MWSGAHGWQWQNWQPCMNNDEWEERVVIIMYIYYSWIIYCHSRNYWGNTKVLLKCKPTECVHIIHATITVSSNFNAWKLNVYDNFKHMFSLRKYLSRILNSSADSIILNICSYFIYWSYSFTRSKLDPNRWCSNDDTTTDCLHICVLLFIANCFLTALIAVSVFGN